MVFHQQDSNQWAEINALGLRLSKEINCAIKVAADGKKTFVCKHSIAFPFFALRGGVDWTWVKERHSCI